MANDSPKNPPPYVSFGVFTTIIARLADSVVPSGALDRHVLAPISGADYGALMSGLRFLGLIDEERKATASFRTLVQASKDTTKFRQTLLGILADQYKPITGTLDLQHGTISELEKAFKEYGVSQGQMLTKTLRFFIKAMGECGVPLSPYITKAKSKSPRTPSIKNGGDRTRTRTRLPLLDNLSSGGGNRTLPKGIERMPIPGLSNAFIQYPADLTEAHCDLFTAMVGVLRTYVKSRAGEKEEL